MQAYEKCLPSVSERNIRRLNFDKMEKLKLKKVTLSEVPADSLNGINGGAQQNQSILQTIASLTVSIIISSAITSGIHCNSSATRPNNSETSRCLCNP